MVSGHFFNLSGPCTSTGGCVQSPNYPNNYGNDEFCEILAPDQPFYSVHFATESGYDYLTVGGQAFSGTSGPPNGITTSDVIRWNSSSAGVGSGWQICTRSALNFGG